MNDLNDDRAYKAMLKKEVQLERELRDEIERLRAALLWIDTYDPETIAAAEAKFGFSLIGQKEAGDE